MCRVAPETLYRRDPDYDLVRYRYRWSVRGTLVRDVATAGLADAMREADDARARRDQDHDGSEGHGREKVERGSALLVLHTRRIPLRR